VIVGLTTGLCVRPAERIKNTVMKYENELVRVTMVPYGTEVDCRSLLDLISLGAEQGTRLILHATGPRARAVLDELAAILEPTHLEPIYND
jgi:phosphocarrier protein HPr